MSRIKTIKMLGMVLAAVLIIVGILPIIRGDVLTNDSITFRCMTRSEANYDYPTVTMDGVEIFNGKSKTSFTSFTVSDAKGKKLVVTYKKDSSQNNDLDRAFLAYL